MSKAQELIDLCDEKLVTHKFNQKNISRVTSDMNDLGFSVNKHTPVSDCHCRFKGSWNVEGDKRTKAITDLNSRYTDSRFTFQGWTNHIDAFSAKAI